MMFKAGRDINYTKRIKSDTFSFICGFEQGGGGGLDCVKLGRAKDFLPGVKII